MSEVVPTQANRLFNQLCELGSAMLRGFAAANEGEAPYRAFAVRNPASVLSGEFPSVSHLIELDKTIPTTPDTQNN